MMVTATLAGATCRAGDAAAVVTPAVPVDAATLATLATQPGWIRRVHYEPARDIPSGWRSAIHGPGFFVDAERGPVDPLAELVATLRGALAKPASPDSPDTDHHVQCRFPGRTAWLRSQLGHGLPWPQVACPAWTAWSRGQRIDRVSLVFATGYLGNPASYYGHTLLKFGTGPAGPSPLQDLTLNFGAVLTGHDDPLTYILKGVFGGYDGGFSDIGYHHHRQQYGEIELRDLWEYELELTPAQAATVAAHAWEVLGHPYTYYFFRRNCAWRVAEVLQIVDGLDLIPPDRPWTIPQSVLQQAVEGRTADGRPLVRRVTHQPSRQSRFHAGHDALTDEEAAVLNRLVTRGTDLGDPGYDALTVPRRQAVLDVLIDYLQFVADPQAREAGHTAPLYRAALAERYRLPPGRPESAAAAPPAPHKGRRPGWLQVGAAVANGDTSGVLRVRPAYYDPLDAAAGHVRDGGMAMGDLQLRLRRGGIRLDHLHVITIDSVGPAHSGLPGDRGEAWMLRAGLEPVKPASDGARVARLQGDIGRSWRLPGDLFFAAYLGGALQDNRHGLGAAAARASADLHWRPADAWGLRASWAAHQPIGGAAQAWTSSRLEARRALGRDLDVRLLHERSTGPQGGSAMSLALGAYW